MPFLFKLAVDWLAVATGTAGSLAEFSAGNAYALAIFASPAAVLIGYGIARTGASAFNGRYKEFVKSIARTLQLFLMKIECSKNQFYYL